MLEEIIVTARRREERLREIPVAASVFGEVELARRQLVDLASLQFAAPNLVISNDLISRSSALIALRGQLESDSVPTLDPAVGVYLDGVYIARVAGANLRLIDMQRVEVLPGPQGTLFGRNTIGGAINLVTNKPTSRLEGEAEAVIGNYDRREFTGVLNVPAAAGRIGLRVAATHVEHDGFGRSSLLDREFDDEDTDFVRVQLALVPLESWALNLAFDHTHLANSTQQVTLVALTPAGATIAAASGHAEDDVTRYVAPFDRTSMSNRVGTLDSATYGGSATVDHDGARIDFKSITAVRRLDSGIGQHDLDGTPYDLGTTVSQEDEQHQFTQEFQFFGKELDGRLDWIAGLYYFEEDGIFARRSLAYVPVLQAWNENLPWGRVENGSVAAYAQFDYAITPRLRATAGLRVIEDTRQLTSRNSRISSSGIQSCRLVLELRDSPDLCKATLPERDFRYVPWTLGVDFRPAPETLLYAKASTGYRAGGYNLRGATELDLGSFEPERVTAFELGAKMDLLSGRLRLDLALFRSLFDDIQLVRLESTDESSLRLRFVQNGGEATIDGSEIQVTGLLGPLQLAAAVGLLDPRFTSLHPNVVDVRLNSKFLQAPEATASVAADLPIPVSFGQVDLHVDYGWRDDMAFAYQRDAAVYQEAYGLLNAMIVARLERLGLDVKLWGRNLTNEQYFLQGWENDIYSSATLGAPRTYGLTLNYRFGTR